MRFIFLLLFSVSFLYGQSKIDSLLSSINSKPDSVKIKLLNDVCWKYRSNAPAFAIQCGEKALEIGTKTGNKVLKARTLNLLGVVYKGVGNPDKSLAYLKRALEVSEEINNPVEIGYAENNIGGSYRLKAYYSLAIQHVTKGYNIFEKLGDKRGMAYCLINIGFIYVGLKNYEKAEEYFIQTRNLRKEIADTLGEAIALSEIAKTLFIEGKLDQAHDKFVELEKIYSRLNDKNGLIQSWWSLGNVAQKRKELNPAYKLYKQAFELSKNIGSLYWQIQSSKSLGLIYSDMGKFTEAEYYIKESLEMARKFSDYSLTSECYDAFSKMYEAKSDYRNALKYNRLYSELKDSITTRENISSVNEMEAVFQNEKVKRENAILQQNIEVAANQRLYSVIIALLFLVISAVIYWRYISEKKARMAQESLRQTEQRYELLFENAFLGIFHCSPDGRFQKVNPAMARILGYASPEDFILSVPDIFKITKFSPDKFNSIITAELSENNWYFAEEHFERKDGTFITANLTIRKETSSNGKISYIEVIFEDITERKLAEEEKDIYSRKLADLNVAKDRFFSIISHDLRGPFHGFLGMTKLLSEQTDDFSKEKLKKMGNDLYKSVQSQYRLLNNLLDWSKIQRENFKLNLKTLNLHHEVNSVIEQIELTARQKNIELQSEIENDLFVNADYDLLHLLLRNLISNAIKFTNPGGSVRIDAVNKDHYIEISVTDNGVGIPEEEIEKLFRLDLKYSTKGTENETGTGLGLTLCNEIAEIHGGFIKVTSKPEEGSTFVFHLPSNN